MPKRTIGISVLEAAKQRISWTFDNFERIYLSFSAGKDSTVMLHLVAAEAKRRQRKFGLLIVDLEGQYKLTIDHAQKCVDMYRDLIELYWVCLPIHLRNAVSVYQPFWVCWEKEKKDIWIRDLPSDAISNEDQFPFFVPGMEFEEFVPAFGEWYSQGQTTACFVGIRADESLNRFRAIANEKKTKWRGMAYTSKVTDNCYNSYPIYDWKTQDIWIFHGKYPQLPYNRLYDQMHQAGLTINQARICQPYGDDQRRGLWLYHILEPETWAKVVARVNGANSGALYMQEWGNVNGYRKITKPDGHSWKTFADLLICSMPPKTKEHYQNKVLKFCKWWEDRAYPEGIPDEVDAVLEAARRAPSWRRICKSLLRNDFWCKGLSFTQTKSDAYGKYLDLMRRKKEAWRDEQINLFGD